MERPDLGFEFVDTMAVSGIGNIASLLAGRLVFSLIDSLAHEGLVGQPEAIDRSRPVGQHMEGPAVRGRAVGAPAVPKPG